MGAEFYESGDCGLPGRGTMTLAWSQADDSKSLLNRSPDNLTGRQSLVAPETSMRSKSSPLYRVGRYCSGVCVSGPFSRMPAPKQSKTTRASTKKKTKLGGLRPGAGRPPIQPNRAAVKIRFGDFGQVS
jgi:hypothetical protein